MVSLTGTACGAAVSSNRVCTRIPQRVPHRIVTSCNEKKFLYSDEFWNEENQVSLLLGNFSKFNRFSNLFDHMSFIPRGSLRNTDKLKVLKIFSEWWDYSLCVFCLLLCISDMSYNYKLHL